MGLLASSRRLRAISDLKWTQLLGSSGMHLQLFWDILTLPLAALAIDSGHFSNDLHLKALSQVEVAVENIASSFHLVCTSLTISSLAGTMTKSRPSKGAPKKATWANVLPT